MKTATYQMLGEAEPVTFIVELDPKGECCPQCGAPLDVGSSQCAYCRTPVAQMSPEQ